MNLWSDFLTNNGRIIHKWKHYFPIYERHFREFVYKPVTFLEIGVWRGGSLQMWKRYFGPHARIIGIDIDPECKKFEEDQVEVYIGQQQDRQNRNRRQDDEQFNEGETLLANFFKSEKMPLVHNFKGLRRGGKTAGRATATRR